METFHYELGVKSIDVLNFFYSSLKEETQGFKVSNNQTLYVASILAHYAQVPFSTEEGKGLQAPVDPAQVIENFFIKQNELLFDPSSYEVGGTQSLLFAGFFRDQICRKHDVKLFDSLGKSLFWRASVVSDTSDQRDMFDQMSKNFKRWAFFCRNLNRTFRSNAPQPLLIKFD